MRNLFLALFFFALTVASAPSSASSPPADSDNLPIPKNIRFERLGLEDGLSQSAILATLQDHQGYLWFGTQDGLNRYDGYSFTVFRHDSENPYSLSSSSILSLAEDADGYLWVGTWGGGLNFYDPIADRFTVFQHNPDDPASLSEDTVTDLLIAQDGTFWIATHGGLNRMNPDGTFTRFQHDPADDHSLSADNLSVLYEDRDGTLWIGTGFGIEGNGLNRLNPDGTFTRYLHDPNNPNSLNSNSIGAIFQDDIGNLWIGTGGYSLAGGGLDRLIDSISGIFAHFQHNPDNPDSLSADNVMSLWQDSSGHLWIGTWGGGINLYDPYREPAIFHHVVNDPYNPHSLSFDVVWDIFSDHSGVVWVGTVPGGISKFTPRTAQFDLYQVQPSVSNSLQNEIISGFFEDSDGTVWVTTWGGGFARFDRRTGEFFHYRNDPANPKSLHSDIVSVLYKDSTEKYWVGSIGTAWFDPQTETFTPVLRNPNDPTSGITATTNSIVEDTSGFVWISTNEGLEKYDPATGQIAHYLHNPENPDSLSSDICTQVFLDREGVLWVGTWGGGLNRYDAQTDTFTHFAHSDDSGSISNDAIWSFQQDHLGQLWIGTEGGLNRMNADGTFTSYRLKDGLPNDNVMGIQEDAEGHLWISTGNGLARFDPVTETFKVFGARDGLQSNEFNSGASFKDRAGLMYFGGVHGFNVFDPAQIRDNQTPPPIVVSTFRVFNKPLPVDLSGNTRLEIPYWQNFIAFEFAALDFQDPQKNQYAYQLEGFDPGWIEAGDRRYASYTSLPAGNYNFRVKASNSDGVWNETGVAIPLTIIPPLWQRWWFLTGAGLLGLGMIAFAVVARISSIRGQQAHLEELVVRRTTELQTANQRLKAEVERRTRAEAALAKRADEELQQSEARFRAMYNQSVIGIGILGLDGKILDANAAVCQMLGRPIEELRQIRFTDVIHPEDRPHGGDPFQQLLSGDRESYRVERRYVRGDGSIFWANVTVSMIYDLKGKPRFAVGMMEDITEQKHTQDEFRHSEERFRATFESSAIGMGILALDGSIVRVNAAVCEMSGYTEEELIRRNDHDNVYPEDRGVDEELARQLILGERDSYQIEKRYVRKNGEVFWAKLTLSSGRDADGKPLYLIGMIEDIDEQKRNSELLARQEADYRRRLERRVEERTRELTEANQRLQEEIQQRQRVEQALAEKAAEEAIIAERTRLARDLHDAVTQTLFSASLIAEVLPDLWEINREEALKSIDELKQLTRGALAEMRTLLLELRPATLTQARFEDLIKQLAEALVGRARLPIQVKIDGERKLPPDVQVALYRIAQESLNNVVKYAQASQVDVHVIYSPTGVHLEIADNGIGFELKNGKPTSLGLRIMRERAEAIEADLSIESCPGQGTRVAATWIESQNGR